jgi:hypothetical protein
MEAGGKLAIAGDAAEGQQSEQTLEPFEADVGERKRRPARSRRRNNNLKASSNRG